MLSGGGDLSTNRTISHQTVGTAGTYSNIVTNSTGHITSARAIISADIPTLPPSKILEDSNDRFVSDIQINSWTGTTTTVSTNSADWETASTNSHTHSNKSTLDLINQSLNTSATVAFSQIDLGKGVNIGSLGNTNWLHIASFPKTDSNTSRKYYVTLMGGDWADNGKIEYVFDSFNTTTTTSAFDIGRLNSSWVHTNNEIYTGIEFKTLRNNSTNVYDVYVRGTNADYFSLAADVKYTNGENGEFQFYVQSSANASLPTSATHTDILTTVREQPTRMLNDILFVRNINLPRATNFSYVDTSAVGDFRFEGTSFYPQNSYGLGTTTKPWNNIFGLSANIGNISGTSITVGNVSNTEFQHLDTVSANIQTQLNNLLHERTFNTGTTNPAWVLFASYTLRHYTSASMSPAYEVRAQQWKFNSRRSSSQLFVYLQTGGQYVYSNRIVCIGSNEANEFVVKRIETPEFITYNFYYYTREFSNPQSYEWTDVNAGGGTPLNDTNPWTVTTTSPGASDIHIKYVGTNNIVTNVISESESLAGAFVSRYIGDVNFRQIIYNNGRIEWGDGANPRDTNLYRSTADVLRTDDNLSVGGIVSAVGFRDTDYVGNRVLVSDSNKTLVESDITTTELNFLDNASANIQTQLSNLSATKANFTNGADQRVAVFNSSNNVRGAEGFIWNSYDLIVSAEGSGGRINIDNLGNDVGIRFRHLGVNKWFVGANTPNKFIVFDYTTSNNDIDITSGANGLVTLGSTTKKVNLPSLSTSAVVVTDGSKNLISSPITTTELGYLDNVTSNIQTQLNTKLTIDNQNNNPETLIRRVRSDNSWNTTLTWDGFGFVLSAERLQFPYQTENRVLVLDANKRLLSSNVTNTELSYLTNVSANIQTQLSNLSATKANSFTISQNQLAVGGTNTVSGSNNLTFDGSTLGLGVSANINNPKLNIVQNPLQAGGAELFLGGAGVTNDENSGKLRFQGNNRLIGLTNSQFKHQVYNNATSAWETIWEKRNTNPADKEIGFTGPVAISAFDGTPRVLVSNASKQIAESSTITVNELNFLDNVSANIQTQLSTLSANKADKNVTITAGTMLSGGGDLSTNRTISHQTVGTAGTYSNIITNSTGHITSARALIAGDIPTLPPSKILEDANDRFVSDTQINSWTGTTTTVSTNSANWNTAFTNTHTHTNKSTLDLINQSLNISASPTFETLIVASAPLSAYTSINPTRRISQTMANNDNWQIYGEGTVSDVGSMFIETGDNGNEPINLSFRNAGNRTIGYTFLPTSLSAPNSNAVFSSLSATSITVGNVSNTEFQHLDGVTSNIQTQLNTKANSSQLTSYLPLSGGTMTGDLVLDRDSPWQQIIYRPNDTGGAGTGIKFRLRNNVASSADYSGIQGYIVSNTNGSHTGGIKFRGVNKGTEQDIALFSPEGLRLGTVAGNPRDTEWIFVNHNNDKHGLAVEYVGSSATSVSKPLIQSNATSLSSTNEINKHIHFNARTNTVNRFLVLGDGSVWSNANISAVGDFYNTTYTGNRALISGPGKNLIESSVTNTELSYLTNVSANIQTQLNQLAQATVSGNGAGTPNRITKFTTSASMGDSSITDTGSLVTFTTPVSSNNTITAPNFTGLASRATSALQSDTLKTARSFSLSGEVTSTNVPTFNGSGNIVLSAVIANGINATKIADGSVTSTEFQYINTLSANAQTQLSTLSANKANTTTSITAGTMLSGGGDLSTNRTISHQTVGTAGTYSNIVTNSTGHITSARNLLSADIPTLPATKIGTGIIDDIEFNHLNTVSANIQTQLNGKLSSNATAGGDLGGAYPNPSVLRIAGVSVALSQTGPLYFNGATVQSMSNISADSYTDNNFVGSRVLISNGKTIDESSITSTDLTNIKTRVDNSRIGQGTYTAEDGISLSARNSRGINFGRMNNNTDSPIFGGYFNYIQMPETTGANSQTLIAMSNTSDDYYFGRSSWNATPNWKRVWHSGDFTSANISNWNTAFTNNHTHSNKSTLDLINQSLNTSATISANIFHATNNGNGQNFRVGDDAWIGDINVENTMSIRGVQNLNVGYINFGSNGLFGYDGNSLISNKNISASGLTVRSGNRLHFNYDLAGNKAVSLIATDANRFVIYSEISSADMMVFNNNAPILALRPLQLSGADLNTYSTTNPTNGYIWQQMAANDYWKIYGEGLSDNGSLIIEVGDNYEDLIKFGYRNTSNTRITPYIFGYNKLQASGVDAHFNSISASNNLVISSLSGTNLELSYLDTVGKLNRATGWALTAVPIFNSSQSDELAFWESTGVLNRTTRVSWSANSLLVGSDAKGSVTNFSSKFIEQLYFTNEDNTELLLDSSTDTAFLRGKNGIGITSNHNINSYIQFNLYGDNDITFRSSAIDTGISIIPKATDTSNLGSTSRRFNNIYTRSLFVSGGTFSLPTISTLLTTTATIPDNISTITISATSNISRINLPPNPTQGHILYINVIRCALTGGHRLFSNNNTNTIKFRNHLGSNSTANITDSIPLGHGNHMLMYDNGFWFYQGVVNV
jgi:hypothetical protein